MQLVPKLLIAGVIAPELAVPASPSLPVSAPMVTVERFNYVWTELAPLFGYRGMQLNPDGSAGQLMGAVPDDAVVVQPPLLQVRDPVLLGTAQAAEKAQTILKTLSRHFHVNQAFQLGIKFVFHADTSRGDARGFVLNQLLSKADSDLGALPVGSEMWVGLKVVSQDADLMSHTVLIEPLVADMSKLYVDVDAQWAEAVDLDTIRQRAVDVAGYIEGAVKGYLEGYDT